MVLIFRTFALKEADAETIEVEEEVPEGEPKVPEILVGSPEVQDEKSATPNQLSASHVSLQISGSVAEGGSLRTIKRQKSLRSQNSTVMNMKPIRDPALCPQELKDSQRMYRLPFSP